MHSLPSLFGTTPSALFDHFRGAAAAPLSLALADGRRFHVLAALPGRRPARWPATPSRRPPRHRAPRAADAAPAPAAADPRRRLSRACTT